MRYDFDKMWWKGGARCVELVLNVADHVTSKPLSAIPVGEW